MNLSRRKAFWTGLCLPAFLSKGQSQATKPAYTTEESLNGRGWRLLDPAAKALYLVGLQDGLTSFGIELALHDKATKDLVFEQIEAWTIPHFTKQEISQKVDELCTDSMNLNLPIYELFKIVALIAKGSNKDQIDRVLSGLRQRYNH